MLRKLLALVLVLGTLGFFIWNSGDTLLTQLRPKFQSTQERKPEVKEKPALKGVSFLMIGIDYRPGEAGARSDSIIYVNMDLNKKMIAALSIPRDTRVWIPNKREDKINAAYALGGPELLMKTTENLLGVPVREYLETDFAGFVDVVDAVGGITIDVEKRMYYKDELGTIDLHPGVQRLNGRQALGYVRFRHDKLGDIGRTERQLKFIQALGQEMLNPRAIARAPGLVSKFKQAVKTNLSLGAMIDLVKALGSVKQQHIVTQTLPGRFVTINGISYWGVDPTEAKEVTKKLLQGQVTPEVIKG